MAEITLIRGDTLKLTMKNMRQMKRLLFGNLPYIAKWGTPNMWA